MKTHNTLTPAAVPEGITRKGFLGGIGAVIVGTLAARGSAHAATLPTRDVIRQSELQSVFDDLEGIQTKILGYRRRLLSGSQIEAGKLTAEFDLPHRGLGTEEQDHGTWDEFEAYYIHVKQTK